MPTKIKGTDQENSLAKLEAFYPDIDFQKYIALINDNYSTYELAAEFNISQNKAWRLKVQLNKANQLLQSFKNEKLDVMLLSQLTAFALQIKLLEFFLQDSEFNKLTTKEKIWLLPSTNRITGTLEDKQIAIVNVRGNVNIQNITISDSEAKELQDESASEMAKTVLTSVKQIP